MSDEKKATKKAKGTKPVAKGSVKITIKKNHGKGRRAMKKGDTYMVSKQTAEILKERGIA